MEKIDNTFNEEEFKSDEKALREEAERKGLNPGLPLKTIVELLNDISRDESEEEDFNKDGTVKQ